MERGNSQDSIGRVHRADRISRFQQALDPGFEGFSSRHAGSLPSGNAGLARRGVPGSAR